MIDMSGWSTVARACAIAEQQRALGEWLSGLDVRSLLAEVLADDWAPPEPLEFIGMAVGTEPGHGDREIHAGRGHEGETMDLAYTAEAAARQGKFKEISNRFFADQTKVEQMTDVKPYIKQVVKDLKLNEEQFNSDFKDGALQGVIRSDLELGDKLGINATPTFFLDGKQLESMAPLDLLNLLKDLK